MRSETLYPVIPSEAAGAFQFTVAPSALYKETIPTGASWFASGAPLGSALGVVVGASLSDATGVGVTVVASSDEFFEITATAKTKIPTTTAATIPLEEPLLLLDCVE